MIHLAAVLDPAGSVNLGFLQDSEVKLGLKISRAGVCTFDSHLPGGVWDTVLPTLPLYLLENLLEKKIDAIPKRE